ncbi:MAG: alkaline phosphatase family protein, partial [Candidatus Marinimicrobia bacterium]|nr:alkaline phosphatase family protein [Candidatus Neomarinimicrobiota bacterium]
AKGMIPVFVSKTFPNHYSIATGMYAENHGLIGNHFYDAELDDNYTLSDRSKVQDAKFYGGEPIWVTAEKQGLKTASYFWVGTEAPIGGIYSSKWKKYEHNFPFEARIDSIVSWFSLPLKERPRFCSLYFHEPDWTGHETGPRSQETEAVVLHLDSLFGDLISKLEQLPISNNLNIIAVADHGMAEISSERTVDLSAYTDMSQIIQEGSGPYAFLYSKKKNIIEPAVDQLKNAEHISVYLKNEIPDRYHFKNHHRIKDALIVADEGWYIQNQAISSSSTAGEYIPTGGTHGYDNQLKSMHALFIAQGPAFKKDIVTEPFENVNIYPMIAHILGIDPSKNIDGNLNNIKHLLK